MSPAPMPQHHWAGANLAAEPDHALATRQYNNVEPVAGRTYQ